MRMMRIAAVTAGLAAAGAVFGTIAGALVLGAWVVAVDSLGPGWAEMRFVLEYAMIFGGVPGAILGPLAAWLLMRHVPLWLAVGGTTLGTLASGGLALLLSDSPFTAMLFGMLGFVVSVFAVRGHGPDDEPRLIEE